MELWLEIPDDITTCLEARVESSKFDSTEEYVIFVLDEVTTPRPEFENMDSAESKRDSEVRDQLESLGYL